MKIDSLKELQKIIRLCRKEGVSDIEIAGIKMHIGPITDYGMKSRTVDLTAFPEASVRVPQYSPVNAQDTSNINIPEMTSNVEQIDMPDELTYEQQLFYSAKQEPN